MFEKYKAKKLYKSAAEKIILPELGFENTAKHKKTANRAFRYAVSFSLVAVLCVGIYCMTFLFNINEKDSETPLKKQANAFTLIACAAENVSASGSSGDIVLRNGGKIKFVNGKLSRKRVQSKDTNGKINTGYDVGFDETAFTFSGNNIDSVTFSAEDAIMRCVDHSKDKKMVCEVELSKIKEFQKNTENIDYAKELFIKYWNAGKFDNYKNKYFKNRSVRLEDYEVVPHFGGNNNEIVLGMEIKNKNDIPSIDGKSVTANVGAYVFWNLPEDIEKQTLADVPLDFTKLKNDTVTITVNYHDGKKSEQKVILSFDKDGYLCAEMK